MIDKNSGLLSLILGGYEITSYSKYKKAASNNVKAAFYVLIAFTFLSCDFS